MTSVCTINHLISFLNALFAVAKRAPTDAEFGTDFRLYHAELDIGRDTINHRKAIVRQRYYDLYDGL